MVFSSVIQLLYKVLFRPFSSLFFSVVLLLNPRIYAVFFGFSRIRGKPHAQLFFRIFSPRFLSLQFRRESRKGTENYLPCCRDVAQPKGNDREFKHEKKTLTDSKKSNPPKVFYKFFQDKIVCPLQAKVVCPLTFAIIPTQLYQSASESNQEELG